MSDGTKIEWSQATWNVVTGCTKVSEGCDHCYIERTPPFRMARRSFDKPGIGGTTGVLLHPDRLRRPLTWRKPRRIFVNSLSDLFHDDIPDRYIASVFAVMAATPHHSYQLLTKRPARMRSLLCSPAFQRASEPWRAVGDGVAADPGWPLPNVWIGVSVENQKWADIRTPLLLDTPAAVRWLSCEPLLGPVKLPFENEVDGCTCYGGAVYGHEPGCGLEPGPAWGNLHWVVAGGESGAGSSRPMHPDWARSLRDQCARAGVPFFHKQFGEFGPVLDNKPSPGDVWVSSVGETREWQHEDGRVRRGLDFWRCGDSVLVRRMGKKAAGRTLDGRTHDEYPILSPSGGGA